MKKIAIIGAGLSGLSLAHMLKGRAEITLFEKARGVSGRMSTRYADPYFFDHGAQYFTARHEAFKKFIHPYIESGLIQRWNAKYAKLKSNRIVETKDWISDEPRYVCVPGMNRLVQCLAENQTVHINTRIITIEKNNAWHLIDDQGHSYGDFDWVISTVPVPQAIDLLPNFFLYHSDIASIKMKGCFSLMLGFEESLALEFEAAHVTDSDLSWIAVNSSKPGRSDMYTLMVHSSEQFAESHLDDDRDIVMERLINETSRIIACDVSHAAFKTLHGWRYANNAIKSPVEQIFIDPMNSLAACGDWCEGGRVEGAFTSAYQLALELKEYLD